MIDPQLKPYIDDYKITIDHASFHFSCRRCHKWFRIDRRVAKRNDETWAHVSDHMTQCRQKQFESQLTTKGGWPEKERTDTHMRPFDSWRKTTFDPDELK